MSEWANKLRAYLNGEDQTLVLSADEAAAASASLPDPQASTAPSASAKTSAAQPVDASAITAAERTRWSAVLASPAAAGKQAAAQELLAATELPSDKIIAMLPKLGADVAASAVTGKAGKTDAALAIEAATPKVRVSGSEPANDGAADKAEDPMKSWTDIRAHSAAITGANAFFGGAKPAR